MITVLLTTLGLVEFGLDRLVKSLRPVFPWLIIRADETPVIDPEMASRHGARSFDPDLGWCHRPGGSGTEVTEGGTTTYRIGEDGARRDPGSGSAAAAVACFGDSFTFCRLVDDDHTWPHHLAEMLGVRVSNYGVGNYGLDQALLRLRREMPTLDAEVVVIGVVPETIARIHSYWKHYFEYGNILAFKPRFTLGDEGLHLHPPAVRTPEGYLTYRRQLDEIQVLDPFLKAKFRRDVLCFPYLPKLVRRSRRHLPILYRLAVGKVSGQEEEAFRAAFEVVMRDNSRWTYRLFQNPAARALLRALVAEFAVTCHEAGKQALILVIPQPSDLRQGTVASAPAIAAFGDVLPVVDVTAAFLRHPEPDLLYVRGRLGPHPSDLGNQVIAGQLAPIVAGLRGRRDPVAPVRHPSPKAGSDG